MATDRKSIIQVKFRLRRDVLRKLERAAKANDRSTNDEIGRRLEDSFEYGNWREQRERLLLAITGALEQHPEAAATAKSAMDELQDDADRDAGRDVMKDLEDG